MHGCVALDSAAPQVSVEEPEEALCVQIDKNVDMQKNKEKCTWASDVSSVTAGVYFKILFW